MKLSNSLKCRTKQYIETTWYVPGASILSIVTFTITTLSKMGLFATLRIRNTQHNSLECRYAECRYAGCHVLL